MPFDSFCEELDMLLRSFLILISFCFWDGAREVSVVREVIVSTVLLIKPLNFRECQRRMLVSSSESWRSRFFFSRYSRLINQARGSIRSRERRGIREKMEFRDWERKIIMIRE